MDLRTVQTFLKVVDLGSFTRAAEDLNYVQSTVTSQIQQLERELGFPLFDRIGKRVFLTAMGQDFLSYANRINSLVMQSKTLNSDLHSIKGSLNIGVLESLLFSTMVTVLPRFQQLFPNVSVQIQMGQGSDLLSLLKQNKLDMVYTSGNLNTDSDLCCWYQRQENLIFVASPDHPALHTSELTMHQLFSYPFTVTEHSGTCYGRLQDLAAATHETIRSTLTIDSVNAVGRVIAQNGGISFLPEYFVQEQLRRGELAKVNVPIGPQVYYSQILCHKNKWISPFMEELMSCIRDTKPEI